MMAFKTWFRSMIKDLLYPQRMQHGWCFVITPWDILRRLLPTSTSASPISCSVKFSIFVNWNEATIFRVTFFSRREDWSHAFYTGKLCEKLGYSNKESFSYYDKAIELNPSAVDAVYRMHASRLKLLCTCGKQNREALKVVLVWNFSLF